MHIPLNRQGGFKAGCPLCACVPLPVPLSDIRVRRPACPTDVDVRRTESVSSHFEHKSSIFRSVLGELWLRLVGLRQANARVCLRKVP
jgi:hypothetical protein